MIFVFWTTLVMLSTIIMARVPIKAPEPLSTVKGSYVNFESAVNPEYYNRIMEREHGERYGTLVLHRKVGLSVPNDVIVYSTWMTQELERFVTFLNDYVCLKKKKCWGGSGFREYLEGLDDQNEVEGNEFFKTLAEPEFIQICQNIIDIFDKFYDTGYCGYEILKSIRPVLRDIQQKINYSNKAKFKEIITQVLSIDEKIVDYIESCE